MSDPQAALSRAQDVLHDALDEARSIVGNPSAGAKPRAVAEAVLEASPLVDEALDGWPDEPGPPDEGGWTVLPDGDHALKKLDGRYRAETPLGARITVPCQLAAGAVADGLVFQKGVEVGAHALLTGCRATAKTNDVMYCVELAGEGSAAEFCDVVDFAHRGVLLTGKGSECRDSHVHGQRPGAASNTDSVAAVMFGGWKAHDAKAQAMLGARLLRCLVEDLEWRCAVEGKASGWTVEACTAIGKQDGRAADCYVRHGTDNVFRSCFVEKGGIQLGGDRHRADGCEASGGIAFKKGGVNMEQMRAGADGYPYARDCVITCTGSAVVTDWANGSGEDWAHMPVNSKVAGVDEGQLEGKGPCEVDEGEVPDPPPPPARKISPDEVGPGARPDA